MNLLELLNDKEKELIIIKDYKESEILFHENDICNEIGIVLEGSLKISSFLYNGQEVVYKRLKNNDIFGSNLIFSNDNKYRGNIISITNSKVALIEKDDFLHLLSTNKILLVNFLEYQSNNGLEANKTIKLLSYNKAEDRFFYYLRINNNSIKFDSITELASELNMQRETLSRLISSLEKKNIINRIENSISLNTKENQIV